MNKKKKSAESLEAITLPEIVPVIVTGDMVAFPSVLMSIYIFDEKNKQAVQIAEKKDQVVLMLATTKAPGESFEPGDLPPIGVVSQITKIFRMSDGRIKILLQGLVRCKVEEFLPKSDHLTAKISPLPAPTIKIDVAEKEILVAQVREKMQMLVELEHLPEEILLVTEEIEDPGVLADVLIAHFKLDIKYAQSLLEELNPLSRLKLTNKILADDLSSFLVAENIRSKTQDEMSKGQRDYFLREQLKQIRKELGDDDYESDDLDELKKALDKAKLTPSAQAEADRQLKRLERMPMESGEYGILRTYLEWLADLPWAKKTTEKFEISKAKKILDEDHFGLGKPKDRILEFLSVRKLKKDSKGPILCFVGPPGVGKTSLGKSIARALNRKFFRLSLGGVRDEAEIRGHRRTYMGALPGRIIQGLKEAGANNPVFMLDELDKIGADFRGDPAAALLEILDPHQNKDFRDHYLNLPFDISDCFFISTANTLDTIPEPLQDRLELISIPGYTTAEKLNIAKRYLIPRQTEENGLKDRKLKFEDSAILMLIERYTQEAGVRSLEREIGSICRKVARALVAKEKVPAKITAEFVISALGPTRFDPELVLKEDQVGLANGLAWTVVGGEVMQVEASVAPGKGMLNLTGQLGDVMQESAQAAMFFCRANAEMLHLPHNFHEKFDLHIHLPEGATPKDGPSAGITLVTALVSALSNKKIKSSVAMTGEVTLRGNVIAIGGLKEKALAALRFGIKTVIIPKSNIKDLQEIPADQRKQIKFVPVERIEEVLAVALEGSPVKVKTHSTKHRRVIKNVRA